MYMLCVLGAMPYFCGTLKGFYLTTCAGKLKTAGIEGIIDS